MTGWCEFLATLDTPGGHIVVLLALALVVWHMPGADKYQAEIIGALLLGLRGTGAAPRV